MVYYNKINVYIFAIGGAMKILVVDDDNIIRMGLCKIIKKMDDRNEIAGSFPNGKTALEYLMANDGDIDLVITDIKMPIMTGIELIKFANEKLKYAPLFVVLSGYDEFSYVRDSMKMGAFNYLLKPISKEELKKLIEEAYEKLEIKKNGNKMYEQSAQILTRDLFKNILFSNKDTINKADNLLTKNFQINEEYIYRLIVVDAKQIKENEVVVSKFIKEVYEKSNGLKSCSFHYKDCIYIIFYINTRENKDFNRIMDEIEKMTWIFAENNMNVFINNTVDEVYKIHRQADMTRKMVERSKETCGQTYCLNKEDSLNHILNDKDDRNETTVIKLAKDYIIDNYNKNITLKDVADKVYLSHNYLSELFKKQIGEGFYEFLSNYRIKKSKEILLTTNLKIYEVAEKVGYNDSISFGRVFKKVTGMTPNEFRNKSE